MKTNEVRGMEIAVANAEARQDRAEAERDALRAEVERLRSALQALATVYGPLSSSMKIGSERRMLWDAAFKELERRP